MNGGVRHMRVIEGGVKEPPYPADTSVVGSRFPLDLPRMTASNTWTLAAPTPELRPWLLMLWAISWTQVPAGAYDDDDALIAARIGMPLTMFKTYRSTLMRGWWKASDGRLYHNIVSELVLDKLAERQAWRKRHGAVGNTSHRGGTAVHHGGTARAGAGAGAGGTTTPISVGTVETTSYVGKGERGKPEKPLARKLALPPWIDPHVWQTYLEMRQRKRAPLVEGIWPKAFKRLEKLAAASGHRYTANEILEHCTLRSWQGFFLPKDDDEPHRGTRHDERAKRDAERTRVLDGLTGPTRPRRG